MKQSQMIIPVNNVRIVANVYSVNEKGNVNLMFLHPTGLCKETWEECIQLLAKRLPTIHLIFALDARNHGDSQVLNQCSGQFDWSLSAKDLIAVVDYLALRPEQMGQPLVLIGHSFGGNNAIFAQLMAPGLATSLIVIEPIVQSQDFVDRMMQMMENNSENDFMVTNALKRRGVFDNHQQAKDSFLAKQFFKTWSSKSLDSYVNGALYKTQSGNWALKCPPEQEAATFAAAYKYGPLIYENLPKITCPVLVLSGEKTAMLAMKFNVDGKMLFKDEAIAMHLPNSQFSFIKGAAHMVPQEAPEVTMEVIADFIESLDLSKSFGRVSKM
jgi:pimeloyl-ACP methyl ester carboxylesterase